MNSEVIKLTDHDYKEIMRLASDIVISLLVNLFCRVTHIKIITHNLMLRIIRR